MKNKYKVEFIEKTITKYCVDVLAKTEEEAEKIAGEKIQEALSGGTIHYHETDKEATALEIDNIYDVTGTDDPFNADNNENCENIGEEVDGFGLCELCGTFHYKKQ